MNIWQKLKTCLMSPVVVSWYLTWAHVYLGLTSDESVEISSMISFNVNKLLWSIIFLTSDEPISRNDAV